MVTLRRSDFALLATDGLAGLVMILVGLIRLRLDVNVWRLAGFAGYLALAGIAAYGLFVLPTLLAFWFPGSNFATFVDPFWDFNSLPMGIYNRMVQNIGTYAIPIFLVTNFPTLFLLDRMTPVQAVWGIVSPLLLVWLTRVRLSTSDSEGTTAPAVDDMASATSDGRSGWLGTSGYRRLAWTA